MLKKYLFLVLVYLLAPFVSPAQLKVGDKAPELVITNWIKNIPKSTDLKGKFVIIDFWATWCAPCLESMPHMNNLINKNKSRSNLVFLAMTDEKVDKVNWLLKRIPFSAAVVADTTRQTSENYSVSSIPFCVVIDDKNIIRWTGHSADLTNETIDKIMEGEIVSLVEKDKSSLPDETKTMYNALYDRYARYFDDEDLKEYFSMGPIIPEKFGAEYLRGGDKRYPYKGFVVGDKLGRRLSLFLDVAENQILLPDNLSSSCISYCYKSQAKNKKEQVMDTILHSLHLKYSISDSLMDVIQMEVADKETLKRFLADSIARVGRSSSSDTYAAIDYDDFSKLTRAIEEKFQKVVVMKSDSIWNRKMSLTIKIDNIQNLTSSLKPYGIKTTMVKKKLPVYRFLRRS